MIRFRGTTKEGEVVEGYYAKVEDSHLIIPDGASLCLGVKIMSEHDFLEGFVEVLPLSLAMSTGISDKNKVPIYGSFEVDGVMSEGGDKLRDIWPNPDTCKVYWKKDIAGFFCKWGDGSDMPLNRGVAANNCEVIPKETE